MMNPFLPFQVSKGNMELVEKLHNKMDGNFLEHTMYDINDALTTILALCDMEQVKSIPKIKKYIERINNSLRNVQVYQDKGVFNVNHVLNNVIDVIDDNLRHKVQLECSLTPINALAKSNQTIIERILLYLLIEIITSPRDNNDDLKLIISLNQAEKDARIVIKKYNFSFSPAAMKDIDALKSKFAGKLNINTANSATEIDIRIPLDFTRSHDVLGASMEKSYDIEVTSKKTEHHPVQSFKKA
jgi:hypothetical protein